jgi:hypothetical protein
MTDISVLNTAFQVENRSWLLSPHGTDPGTTPSITLDVSAFTAGVHYPNGYIPSGTNLAKITASGLYGPYTVSNEVQVLTVGGSGLTSFTVTFGGQTTAAIPAAATAAQVQSALEALSTIGTGNVVVTGSAGGPWTITFQGALAGLDNAQVTTTPTGGTGTVTPSTTTAGGTEGSGGLEVCAGHLFSTVKVPNVLDTTKDVGGALLVHGFVKLSKLPFGLNANGQTDCKLIHYVP